MRKIALTTITAIALATSALAQEVATPGLVQEITMDTVLGTTMEDVIASLTGMGFEVRKYEIEGGKIEVYFVGNGKLGEVYVDPQTGKPTQIKWK